MGMPRRRWSTSSSYELRGSSESIELPANRASTNRNCASSSASAPFGTCAASSSRSRSSAAMSTEWSCAAMSSAASSSGTSESGRAINSTSRREGSSTAPTVHSCAVADAARNRSRRARPATARAREPEHPHEAVARRLRRSNQRLTANREALVELLAETPRPLTMPEILGSRAGLAQSSVYRNLVVLEQAGVVHRIVTSDGHARFELAEDLTGRHHHHSARSAARSRTSPRTRSWRRRWLRPSTKSSAPPDSALSTTESTWLVAVAPAPDVSSG
ncbi:MAG: transcriptional repressor [Actinobacteria bacterium]|nr:MAG: transcriptional repressor [Actinomycetota bacterium]